MDRQQIFTFLVIREIEKMLGIKFDFGNPLDRFLLQKMIYLAQRSGVQLGYFYHWSPY